jgi:hypothetical protein
VPRLFREIKELGYTGSFNLLYRYLTQGRAEGDRPVTTPRRFARLTRPENRRDKDTELIRDLTATCLEMKQLDCLIGEFASLLAPPQGMKSGLRNGSRPSASPTCPTCMPSPTASNSTARQSMPPLRCPTTTGAPRCQYPDQTHNEANARKSRIRPSSSPHPSKNGSVSHSVVTDCESVIMCRC